MRHAAHAPDPPSHSFSDYVKIRVALETRGRTRVFFGLLPHAVSRAGLPRTRVPPRCCKLPVNQTVLASSPSFIQLQSGLRMPYAEAGAGELLLFVHGSLCD